jgi:GNAT superfamily N-acetyltransferase
VSGVQFPANWVIENLAKAHNRKRFKSGNDQVDRWFRTSALQSQSKHLTNTKILLDQERAIVGYYTLATSQVDFSDLPSNIAKSLPRRQLPVAVLAWLAIAEANQGQGIGKRLLATALRDCYEAARTFAFIAVILDCVDEPAKDFYRQFDFQPLPGYPMRLFLSFQRLEKMMSA